MTIDSRFIINLQSIFDKLFIFILCTHDIPSLIDMNIFDYFILNLCPQRLLECFIIWTKSLVEYSLFWNPKNKRVVLKQWCQFLTGCDD